MELNNLRMPFWYAVYGEKPSSGRSLYISLHGGGNVPAERLYAGQWFERRGTVRMFCADTGCTDYGLYEYLL